MADSIKDIKLRQKLEREAQQERAAAYESAKKEEKEMLKLRIKNGKLTAEEETKLEKIRQKRRDNYDSWYKEKKKKEEELNKKAEKDAKSRQDYIDEVIDKESGLFSLATGFNQAREKAQKAGNDYLDKSLENLESKTYDVAEAESQIGTSKYTNIDYSTEINDLEKKRIKLKIDYNRALESGDKDAIAEVERKIEANDTELEGLNILNDKGKIMNRQNEILSAGLKPLEDMKDKMKDFATQVEMLVANPMFLMVVLAAALVKHFTATEESMENFRKNMGLAEAEAGKLQDQALGVAKNMADSGVSLDDALNATESLVKEFGDMGMATEENLETVLRMNKALGMSNDEAAKFLHTMSSILGSTTAEAEALAAGATNMARVAGVAPSQVIKDMSANADSFAAYIKDGGKNMAEAAVFAAKMGADLATMTKIADSLLDIEGSIEKQMEAQVLTGRAINLEKARQAAYDGDLLKMGDELLKQVGSAKEFEDMRPEARKAMAAAMGMEVGELSKMISKQEVLKKLADGQLSSAEALAELPLSEVMDAKGITGPITDIKNSISAIALNLMEVFRPVFSAVAFILKPIAYTLGLVAKLLNNPIGKGIVLFYTFYKLINSEILKGMALKTKDFAKDMLRGKWKLAQKAKEAAMGAGGKVKGMLGLGGDTPAPESDVQGKGSGGMMDTLGNMDMNKVLKGAAAMIIVSGALFIFAKALKELPTDPGPYIGAAVGLGMLMGAVFLMGKMQGDLMKGSLAMLVMGVAFVPFAYGLSLIAGLDFASIIAAAGALIIFTAAIFGLGLLMSSGVGAAIFGAGIIAFAALGATLVIFGAGLMLVATAAELLSNSLSGVATGITELVASSDGIFSLAAGLGALALGFISLAGSMMLLLPFLPMLMLLGASGVIGQILGTGEGGGGDAGATKKQGKKDEKSPEVITNMKLDELNSNIRELMDIIREGGTVNMDGKKVGEVIGGAGTMGPLVG